MDLSLSGIFFIGWLASFLGALPFGSINLSVVDTTIKKNLRAGLSFSIAAAVVEILQSFIAVHCNMAISHFFENSTWVPIAIIVLFLGIGLAFMLKKQKPQTPDTNNNKKNSFLKGITIALLNPQALPFWIFVLAYLEKDQMIMITLHQGISFIFLFLLGVAIGKFSALAIFSLLSKYISQRSQFLSLWMNKIIGSVLILIGLAQAYQVVF